MEQIFKWTIPWVAFSQFEYKGDVEWFISFLKELEWKLNEVPDIFGINPQDKTAVTSRLEKANKALMDMQKQYPDTLEIIKKYA